MISWIRRHAFFATASIALVIKLWLTSDIAVVPLTAPHDMSLFAEHAKFIAEGKWLGPYDSLTLIKGPAFPIFLASIREFGISFPLAHQLLAFCSALVACIAIRPLVRDQRFLASAFVLLFFVPDTFDTVSWVTNRSLIGGWFVLLCVSCAAALTLRRDRAPRSTWPWSVGLGVTFSAFWLNREEGVWLVLPLIVTLAPLAARAIADARVRSFGRAATLLTPAALWILAVVAVCALDGRGYGWPTVTEIQSPDFVSAYASLARIEHPPADRRYPVPASALAIAYSVSSAASELRPEFEGPNGDGWRAASCNSFHACEDIAGGWFMWALRQGAELAGHYTSAANARDYYRALSAQIDDACDAGRIRCLRKRSSLAPPIDPSDLPLLASNFRSGLLLLATWGTFQLQEWPASPTTPALVRDYLFVANSEAFDESRLEYDGWLVAPGMARLLVLSSGTPDPAAAISFTASPDVAAAAANAGFRSGGAFARFQILTTCAANCAIRTIDGRGNATDVPLSPGTPDVSNGKLLYHLESATGEADVAASHALKGRLLHAIGLFYQHVVGWLALGALLLLLPDVVPPALYQISDRALLCIAIVLGEASLLAILTIIQTYSFVGFDASYFEALHPLLVLFVIVSFGKFAASKSSET